LGAALLACGLDPVWEPVIERRIVGDPAARLASLNAADWLVLTSPYAIGALPPGPWPCRVAVVGEASRRAALSRGLRVELVSESGRAEGLWRALREVVSSGLVLYPRSDLAEPPEPWADVRIEAPVLYRTAPRAFDAGVAATVCAAAVASASAARAIAGTAALPPLGSIGGATTASLIAAGLKPWREAPTPSFGALARAIADGLAQARSESGSSRHHRA
jgi:uroporphyrinogen-III synthase